MILFSRHFKVGATLSMCVFSIAHNTEHLNYENKNGPAFHLTQDKLFMQKY